MSISKKPVCAIGLGGQSVFLEVEHFHAPGETLHADAIYSEPGGKAYNQAVAARRLGAEAGFIGAVGRDENGRLCEDFLKREGVSPCLVYPGESGTAYACILTDRSGDNRVTVFGGAAAELRAEHIYALESLISGCGVLMLGLECPMDATLAALELAEKAGVFTILNPAPADKADMELIRRFDLITPNAQEAAAILGTDSAEPSELCAALSQQGIVQAAVTLGGNGALLYKSGRGFIYPAVRCEAVDTTGAGDCFNGAVAAALVSGQSLEEAVGFAVNAAALSVTRRHVMTALPTLREVRESFADVAPRLIWEG